MRKKIERNYKCPENTLLLICDNLEYKGKKYDLKKGKYKIIYNIYANSLSYINDNTIKVIINISLENSEII